MTGVSSRISDPGLAPGFFFVKRALLACLALTFCALPFLPGVHGPFLLDDVGNLLRARAASGHIANFLDAIVRNESGLLRRPISNASFLLNYHWLGTTPFHYKAVNLAVHLVNGVLVWLLLIRVFGLILECPATAKPSRLALFVALAWTAHPLHVSTVLYPVQRMAQLSALFTLATVIVGLIAVVRLRVERTKPSVGVWAAVSVLALTLLAMLSKENGALAPALLAVPLLCISRSRWHQAWSHPAPRVFLGLSIVLPLILGALIAALKFPSFLDGYDAREFTMIERLLTQPAVLSHYLATIVWPDIRWMGLYLDDFRIRVSSESLAWAGLMVAVVLPALTWSLRLKAPVLTFGVLWFVAAHLMESTIIPLEIAFEHRNYVASVGPLTILSYYGARGLEAAFQPRARVLIALVPLLALAGLTAQRAHQWSSAERFTMTEVSNHPQSPRALGQAAAHFLDRGELETAAVLIAEVQRLRPSSFWFRAYDIHLACLRGDSRVDTSILVAIARERPEQLGIDAAARPIVIRTLAGECPVLELSELDEFLVQLIDAVASSRRPETIERLYMLRSLVAEHLGSDRKWRDMLRLALTANPQSIESLTVLAYGELNRGNLSEARSAADEMEARLNQYHRSIRRFELNELRRNIDSAESADSP